MAILGKNGSVFQSREVTSVIFKNSLKLNFPFKIEENIVVMAMKMVKKLKNNSKRSFFLGSKGGWTTFPVVVFLKYKEKKKEDS